MAETLHVALTDGILEVTLDRPKANAIDAATSRRMGETFIAFRDDPAQRVAILSAAGERFFSAGWDLKAAAERRGPGGRHRLRPRRLRRHDPAGSMRLDKPVIAAVNGLAIGGGFELALCRRPDGRGRAAWNSPCPRLMVGVVAGRGLRSCLPRPHSAGRRARAVA